LNMMRQHRGQMRKGTRKCGGHDKQCVVQHCGQSPVALALSGPSSYSSSSSICLSVLYPPRPAGLRSGQRADCDVEEFFYQYIWHLSWFVFITLRNRPRARFFFVSSPLGSLQTDRARPLSWPASWAWGLPEMHNSAWVVNCCHDVNYASRYYQPGYVR
jgi:hypothetical protein